MPQKIKQTDQAAELKSANRPDISPTLTDEEAKAMLKANKAKEERILKFSSAHNSQSVNNGPLEERLEIRYTLMAEIDSAIFQKDDLLKSAGQFSTDGIPNRLNAFQKAKLRNQIRNLKAVKTQLIKECRQLEKELTTTYRKDSSRIDRSKVRTNARKDSYHKRHGNSVKNAIQKSVNGFSAEKTASLKSDIENVDLKKGDAILMQALLKAPRHLHTRVVANAEARKGYLEYFRSLLKEVK